MASGRVLVGRERELAALDDALARARRGEPALVLVAGEPGIGKTRLLEEAEALGRGAGAVVAWGRTWELGAAPAFWPWLEVLRALGEQAGEGERGRDRDDPRGAARDAAAVLAGGGAADPAERFAVFQAVAAVLRGAAARAPVLLLFDDLHAADPSSLQLLELVVRQRLGGVAVVATFRDREARRDADVEAALGRIGRSGVALAPARLDRDEVAALARTAGSPPADAGDRLHAQSDGNPLFVLELVAAARDGLREVPRGVRAALRDRLHLLSDAARRALAAAAILGREVDVPLVAAVARVAPAEIAAHLGAAVRAGLVSEVGTDRFRFSHALVGETLVGELDGAARAELHLEAARAIEQRHAGDAAPPHAAIAHHLLEAGHLAAALAVDAAARAADAAMAQLAFEDAAALLERALAALALGAPGDAARRAELTCRLAAALHHAGLHERGRAACAQVAELARALADPALLARAALTRGLEVQLGLVDAAQVALLDEALAAQPPGESATRALLMARLASAQQPAADPRPPIELARAAIAMGRRTGDRAAQLRVIASAMGALTDYVPAEERAGYNRELVALATAPVDRWQALRAQLRLCFDCIELGDRAALDGAVRDYQLQAARFHPPRQPWIEKMIAATVALIDGRFGDDARLASEVEALAAERGDASMLRSVRLHRGLAAVATGDRAAAAAQIEAAGEADAQAPAAITLVLGGAAAALRGDRAAAVDRLDAAGDAALADALHDPAWATMLAPAIALAGPATRRRLVRDALAPLAGRVCVSSVLGFAIVDVVDRALLGLAAADGDDAAVDRHGAVAVDVATRLGAWPWVVLARRDWAAALEARGERARADEQRALAAPVAARLGMAAPAAPATAPDARASTPGTIVSAASPLRLVAEGDVWSVAGLGEHARVRDSRGLQMIARLVAEPHRELHALELSRTVAAPGATPGAADAGAAPDGGDAGELLDDDARAAYRERLAELTGELDQAEAWGDVGRAERARREADALRAELARAVGLGGKARRAGSAAERARSNVTRRIRAAIEHVEAVCPRVGAHLARSIRTGTYCVYEPRDPPPR